MDIITLDFETFYTTEYSLKRLTTEEYIRSPLFDVIGVSVKINAQPAVWFSGSFTQTQRFLAQFDWPNSVMVAHNAMFDAAILAWVYDIHPQKLADTLSMARALHANDTALSLSALADYYSVGVKGTEVIRALGKQRGNFTTQELAEYGRYCCNDTELTYLLFEQMAPRFQRSELDLIDLTLKMFTQPVLGLDEELLRAHLKETQDNKLALLAATGLGRADLMSNDKLADVLRSLGVDPPTKISNKTGKEAFAFAKSDEDFKALLEHEDEAVQAVVAARLGVKSTLEESRTERFIGIAERGLLPVALKYSGAHTHRWSAADRQNLQNLPRGTPKKKPALKKAMKAPKGYVVINADSSQIEARILAWLSGQQDLVYAFANGEDVYIQSASGIYGVPESTIGKDSNERFVGKTTILSAGYGVGWKKFQAALKSSVARIVLPDDECQRIIQAYRQRYAMIPRFWKTCDRILQAIHNNVSASFGPGGVIQVVGERGILLPSGLYISYPNLRRTADGYVYDTKRGKSKLATKIYGGACTENICQALARIIIGLQMLKISKRYRVALTVHDSVVVVVKEEDAEEAMRFIGDTMRWTPDWAAGLPLNCEVKKGATYGDC